MKKFTLNILLFSSLSVFAQQQIGNSNMENWDNVGQQTEEPTNWNSFKTGTGSLVSFGSQQVGRSTSIRSGATGSYCARIYAKSTLGVVANGLLTVGQVNMGSSTASSPDNYNFTKTSDANFSEALTSRPDSLVFWVKYTPVNGSHQARVHAILHESYDFRDPIDANSTPHTVARAELNYGATGGNWVRKSVPFVYEGPATSVEYILITFATSSTPGGGSANDEVLLDDVELIYNPTTSNQPITASNSSSSTDQDTPIQISILSNVSDPENNIDLNSLTIFNQANNGLAVANTNGSILYTPNAGYFGNDAFVYRICDGGTPVTCANAIVNVTVNQVVGFNELNTNKLIVYYSSETGLNIVNSTSTFSIVEISGKTIKENANNGTFLKSGVYFLKSGDSVVKILVP